MIDRRTSTDNLKFEVFCYTCDKLVDDFILITPPQWVDPHHEKLENICISCAEKIGAKAGSDLVENLSMLVRMLVVKLGKTDPDASVIKKATDYLQRKGLTGNVLRDGQ